MDICHVCGDMCSGLVLYLVGVSGDEGVGTGGGGAAVEGWVGS